MNIDFWHSDTLQDVKSISCTFYGNSAEYRGWMFNASGEIIGDYSTTNSIEIERIFKVNFD